MKKVPVTQWYLVLGSHPDLNYESKNFYVYIEGEKANEPGTFVLSKKILAREADRPFEIRAVDNLVYQLRVPFCREIAALHGYPDCLVKKFENGFPKEWLHVLAEFYNDKIKQNFVSVWEQLQQEAMKTHGMQKNEETVPIIDKKAFFGSESQQRGLSDKTFRDKENSNNDVARNSKSIAALAAQPSHTTLPTFLSPVPAVHVNGSPADTDADILRLAANKGRDNFSSVVSVYFDPVKKKKAEKKKGVAKAKRIGGDKETANRECKFNRTRSGRLVKPRLHESAGQRIVYDMSGNPIELLLGDARLETAVDLTKYAEELHVSKVLINQDGDAPQAKIMPYRESKMKANIAKKIPVNKSGKKRKKTERSESSNKDKENKSLQRQFDKKDAPTSWPDPNEVAVFRNYVKATSDKSFTVNSEVIYCEEQPILTDCFTSMRNADRTMSSTNKKSGLLKTNKDKKEALKAKFQQADTQRDNVAENHEPDDDVFAKEIMMMGAQHDKEEPLNLLEPDNLSIATTPGSLAGRSRLMLGNLSEATNSTTDSNSLNDFTTLGNCKRQKNAIRYVHQIQKSMPRKTSKKALRNDTMKPTSKGTSVNLNIHLKKVDKLFQMEDEKRKKLKRFRLESASDEDTHNSFVSEESS